jgi:hypothetical protein
MKIYQRQYCDTSRGQSMLHEVSPHQTQCESFDKKIISLDETYLDMNRYF